MIEQKAKECVLSYFKDYTYLTLFKTDTITIRSNRVYLNGSDTKIKPSKTLKVVLRDNKECVYCNLKSIYGIMIKHKSSSVNNVVLIVDDGEKFIPLTKDHIIAKANGGTDALKNLQSMCLVCNNDKGNVPEELRNTDYKVIHFDELDRLKKRQKEFKDTRDNIHKVIKRLPWFFRVVGVGAYLRNKLKKPLLDLGYYHDEGNKKDT